VSISVGAYGRIIGSCQDARVVRWSSKWRKWGLWISGRGHLGGRKVRNRCHREPRTTGGAAVIPNRRGKMAESTRSAKLWEDKKKKKIPEAPAVSKVTNYSNEKRNAREPRLHHRKKGTFARGEIETPRNWGEAPRTASLFLSERGGLQVIRERSHVRAPISS